MDNNVVKIKVTQTDKPQLLAANAAIGDNLYSIYFKDGVGYLMSQYDYAPGTKVIIKEGPEKKIGEGTVV
jgi:hypothetical protein